MSEENKLCEMCEEVPYEVRREYDKKVQGKYEHYLCLVCAHTQFFEAHDCGAEIV